MKHRAFTLIKLVLTLALSGVLGSFAVISVGIVSERSARQKLVSDVGTLYRAVSSYLAMGGSLAGATEFVVQQVVDTTPVPAPKVVPNPVSSLIPPRLSQPGGTYDFCDFDLPITLTNPNPNGSSKIVYAIDFGAWQNYTGPVEVAPGSVRSAESVSTHTNWGDSGKIDQRYETEPVVLAAPTIAPNGESFGMFFHREVEVVLFNPNSSESSNLEYRIGGGAWTPYAVPFRLQRTDFASVAHIEARAVPMDSPYYLDSFIALRVIPVAPFEANGETAGEFANAMANREW